MDSTIDFIVLNRLKMKKKKKKERQTIYYIAYAISSIEPVEINNAHGAEKTNGKIDTR